MKMLQKLLLGAGILSMVACAPMNTKRERPTQVIGVPFDAEEASRAVQPGPNTIKGSAFLRQRGGGVVTCAGAKVYLIPATRYANMRVGALYGSIYEGFNNTRDFSFVPDEPLYMTLMRNTQCDAQGNFVFDAVADGEFFVATMVTWQAGQAIQGGHVMKRYEVRGGQTAIQVIAPAL